MDTRNKRSVGLKLLYSGISVAVLTLMVGASFALALEVGSNASVTIPRGYKIIPASDEDKANDQITQLNSLTIHEVSGSSPGTIYASKNPDGGCVNFESLSATKSAYPCHLEMDILYRISVQADTILLLRDRTRANIVNFAPGDKINVFGFMDPGTSDVQALIVRNLSKPDQASYMQLNGLAVLSDPGTDLPSAFTVVRPAFDNCLHYSSSAAPRGTPVACPAGVDISISAAELISPYSPASYALLPQTYSIQVNADTRLYNLYRQPMTLGSIEPGDKINVYGLYSSETRTLTALIIRNLFVPRTSSAGVQVLAPNGGESLSRGSIVDIRWFQYPNMETKITSDIYLLRSADCTPPPGKSCFKPLSEHLIAREVGAKQSADKISIYSWKVPDVLDKISLPDGSYKIKVCYSGTSNCDESNGSFLIVQNGSSIPNLSVVNPEWAYPGTFINLRGSGFTPTGNVVYLGGYHIGTVALSDGQTLSVELPGYVSPCPYNPYDPSQNVFCRAIAMELKPGIYPIHVLTKNGASNKLDFKVVQLTVDNLSR